MTPATTTTTRPSTLAGLLDDELAFSPSFRRIYSSHLAMALVALDQMGASPERLQEVFDAHERGGAERRDDAEDLDVVRAEVARDGIEATVRRRAAPLVDGPGTALFHPLIRLAYAIEERHEGQVAAALLDWERRLTPPETVPPAGDRRLHDVAAEISRAAADGWPRTFDLAGTASRPEVQAALDGIAFDERTLDDVSSFALAAHVAADDFITLHLVTGARAVRTVAGVLDDATAARLVAHTVPVLLVAYAAIGAPTLLDADETDALRRSNLPTRTTIEVRAVADDDPHVIKLANVALAEERRSGDRLYRYVAARVVGLV